MRNLYRRLVTSPLTSWFFSQGFAIVMTVLLLLFICCEARAALYTRDTPYREKAPLFTPAGRVWGMTQVLVPHMNDALAYACFTVPGHDYVECIYVVGGRAVQVTIVPLRVSS